MSLLTTFRAPGHGRRQANPLDRVTAENVRVREALRLEREENGRLHADLRHTAAVLGEIVVMHLIDRAALATAVRSNEANANAETVKTDVSALRASIADVLPEEHKAEPQYRPYRRIVRPLIKVVPLWHSPQAAHPARVPGLAELAGAR